MKQYSEDQYNVELRYSFYQDNFQGNPSNFQDSRKTKIRNLNQLISNRQKCDRDIMRKQSHVNFLNPTIKSAVPTKQINLKSHMLESINTQKKANSNKKLHLSIGKTIKLKNMQIHTAQSMKSTPSSAKKQKLKLLSKIQNQKITCFRESINQTDENQPKAYIQRDKQNIQSNNLQLPADKFIKMPKPESLSIQITQKLFQKQCLPFSHRPLKTTRQIKQLKELKQKKKVKLAKYSKTRPQKIKVL